MSDSSLKDLLLAHCLCLENSCDTAYFLSSLTTSNMQWTAIKILKEKEKYQNIISEELSNALNAASVSEIDEAIRFVMDRLWDQNVDLFPKTRY